MTHQEELSILTDQIILELSKIDLATTSNLAEGMYVIQLVSGKGITTSQKLVINH